MNPVRINGVFYRLFFLLIRLNKYCTDEWVFCYDGGRITGCEWCCFYGLTVSHNFIDFGVSK